MLTVRVESYRRSPRQPSQWTERPAGRSSPAPVGVVVSVRRSTARPLSPMRRFSLKRASGSQTDQPPSHHGSKRVHCELLGRSGSPGVSGRSGAQKRTARSRADERKKDGTVEFPLFRPPGARNSWSVKSTNIAERGFAFYELRESVYVRTTIGPAIESQTVISSSDTRWTVKLSPRTAPTGEIIRDTVAISWGLLLESGFVMTSFVILRNHVLQLFTEYHLTYQGATVTVTRTLPIRKGPSQ